MQVKQSDRCNISEEPDTLSTKPVRIKLYDGGHKSLPSDKKRFLHLIHFIYKHATIPEIHSYFYILVKQVCWHFATTK